MAHVVVIGAGLSGCTVACTLADRGVDVTLVEKTGRIGGRVSSYGCKAVERCQNCGVCLTSGLWKKTADHKSIRIIKNTVVQDISGQPGSFSIKITGGKENKYIKGIDTIVVSTGFDDLPGGISSHLHINNAEDIGEQGLMTGTQLEELLLKRTRSVLFEKRPESIAFIQCLGSRDKSEGGLYCSRVCCSYSTRTAKLIRSYYPECKITFFYMELQNVEQGDFYNGLLELDMEFIKCRPAKITGGDPLIVEYDDPAEGIKSREYDIIVLSNGIYACTDNGRHAEICGLGQDSNGFLRMADTGTGVYAAGCAKGPMKIDEAYADAVAIAGKILGEAGGK